MRIAGDIGGLQQVARSLTGVTGVTGVTGDLNGSAEFLSGRVDRLVGDAGWSGAAAEEFNGAWEQDATAVVELRAYLRTMVDDLAVNVHDALRHRRIHILRWRD